MNCALKMNQSVMLQASMITEPGGPFIDISKLNFTKYAGRPALAKALFMYLFHHENDLKSVSDIRLQY